MCGAAVPLNVISSLSDIPISFFSLIIIDASIFEGQDSDFLCQVAAFSDYSLCLVPSNLSPQVMEYIEKLYSYTISYPIRMDYFRDYCFRAINLINVHKERNISSSKEYENLPKSISGFFCGESELIRNVRKQILRAACSSEPVLLLGETGTGKTTAANVIHSLSERRSKEIVKISLSTVVESLAESAFFGHVKGSFTSAEHDKKGCFEDADGSTLFMDELGTASLTIQTMLLSVLETGNFKKVGTDKECHTDVRLIFATNADIMQMMREGTFRSDLYFRIFDNIIKLPPLRDRKEDLREMVYNYLEKESVLVSEDAIEQIESYSWPGNVRELHKCLKRALRNADNNVITADSIDFGDISFLQ